MRADFDADALYLALDEARRARDMSWQEVARSISAQFRDAPSRGISASTLTGIPTRDVLEGDGVLQMLRWLGRAPESFVPGHDAGELLPDVPPNRILRFDTTLMFERLSARRIELGMTWQQVANEIGGVTAMSLTRLSDGGRTGFPHVVRIARWLGCSVASLTRAFSR